MFDGKIDDDHRWSANGYPKSIIIDLGIEKEIVGTRVWTYQSRAYQYKVEVSNSATDGFVQAVDRLSNTSSDQPISDDFNVQKGRYLKLTFEGCHAYASTWVSINELVLMFKDEILSTANIQGNNAALSLYPNPTNASFKIALNGAVPKQVQIYNMVGIKLYDQPYTDRSITLPNGMYIVKVSDANNKI